MKLDLTEIADRAVREAMARHHALIREVIHRLANESGVVVHGVRHVNAARLVELLADNHTPERRLATEESA